MWYYKFKMEQDRDFKQSDANFSLTGTNCYTFEFHKGEFAIAGKALCLHEAEVPAWNTPNLTGLSVWNSGVVGAKYLEHKETLNPGWCEGKTVAELGCGTGILGISLAFTNPAYRVLCTDMGDVLQLTQTNIDANLAVLRDTSSGQARVTAAPLRWEKFVKQGEEAQTEEKTEEEHQKFDVILLSDVVWYMEGVVPLVATLRALTHARSLVLLCFQSRHIEVDLVFWDLIDRHFHVGRVPSSQYHPNFKNPLVAIYELTHALV